MTKGMRKRRNRVFPGRRVPTGLLFSGFIIAISFIAMITPLALFHSAQIAATSRLRTAISLLFSVVAIVLFLGIIGRQPSLIFGGMVGLFWIPIFAFALHQRMTLKPVIFSALLLCLPLFILIFFAAIIPEGFNLTTYLQSFIDTAPSATKANPAAVAEWNAIIQSLQSADGALADFAQFSQMGLWQRLSWFAYGGGSSWLLSSIGVGFANLIFLDFAFEQIEKLKAVAVYVQGHANRFSRPLISALSALMQHPSSKHATAKTPKQQPSMHVVRESSLPNEPEGELLSFLVRPPRANTALIWGHSFEFKFSNKAWRLRNFSLPFALVAVALIFLGFFALSIGESSKIIAATQGQFAPVIAIGGLLAFVVLAIVATQGILVLLERLTSGFLLFLGIAALIGLSLYPMNAHLLLGILGTLGIFDYAYDLRGHLANREKPV